MITELVDKDITNNPVPVFIVGEEYKGKTIGLSEPLNSDLSLLAPAGNLGDLAPTILSIFNLAKPAEMTGSSLIDKK
jgi:bisphosphoglycerate-independent phosphoglycerate mutase (AlkP superfamily)